MSDRPVNDTTADENWPAPRDKRLDENEVVGRLRSGMTIGIGGWGSRRKPMSLVRAILRSDLSDLHLVTFGGPEVGMLCAAGKVAHLTFAFVAPDIGPAAVLEPHFRAARQSGSVECTELDEGMLLLGLQAAAWRVPFLPTRVGLGSDLNLVNPGLKTVRSPYPGPGGGDGEELIAQPAIELDAALCHLNVGDTRGNAAFTGPDLYFDDLMLEAAADGGRFISVEKVVSTSDLVEAAGDVTRLRVSRMFVDGVVEAPNGCHPTSCDPDRVRDEAFQKEYLATAKDPEMWASFRSDWLSFPDEAAYQAALAARPAEEARS
ncbi:MAG: CoA transferase subunit A [Microthrixaceae bacterium]|nr:CoA transferase subunit A [Microthrixaceae bacterium]